MNGEEVILKTKATTKAPAGMIVMIIMIMIKHCPLCCCNGRVNYQNKEVLATTKATAGLTIIIIMIMIKHWRIMEKFLIIIMTRRR